MPDRLLKRCHEGKEKVNIISSTVLLLIQFNTKQIPIHEFNEFSFSQLWLKLKQNNENH